VMSAGLRLDRNPAIPLGRSVCNGWSRLFDVREAPL
jgi:hypothetical protein